MNIGTIYAKNFLDLANGHICVMPNIPKDKLYKAIASYGADIDRDEIILLYDDTVMGSGAEGFLLTRDMLCYKERFDSPSEIVLTEDNDYSAGRGIINKTFLVNGQKRFVITQLSFSEAQALVARIDDLAKGNFDTPDTEEPDDEPSPSSSHRSTASGKKKCPFCAEEINAEAIKCRFCGEMLPSNTSAAPQRKPSVAQSDNRLIAILQEFIEDGDQAKLERQMQQRSEDEAGEAEEILNQRIMRNDTNAMAITAMLILLGTDENTSTAQLKKGGELMGKSANMGNHHAARILQNLKQTYAVGTGEESTLRMMNVFLQSAAMEYSF